MEEQAKARAMNAFFTSAVPKEREYDPNGNLRITLRFMRTGLLKYAPTPDTFPDGVPPDAIGPDGMVTVYVDPEDLGESESLRSLSGLDGLREHEWVTPDDPRDAVASVAGIPGFDGSYVDGEALVKEADTIRRLELPDGHPDKLEEVSAGYGLVMDWTPGEFGGEQYAGRQKEIRYNHFVFLPKGEGRAGGDVRVTNSKEKAVADNEYVPFFSRIFGRKVYAKNERDAEEMMKAENESTDGNERANNDDGQARRDRDAARHEAGEIVEANERKSIIDEMKATIQSLTDERDGHAAKIAELEAMLNELRSSIDSGEADDRVEERADEMQAEREEAAEVMNACGAGERSQALNAFKEQKLRGRELKVFAMNSIREKKGREAIPEEQASNDIAVNAMWDVVKEGYQAPAKTNIVGSPFAGTAMNSSELVTLDQQRKHTLGFREKK